MRKAPAAGADAHLPRTAAKINEAVARRCVPGRLGGSRGPAALLLAAGCCPSLAPYPPCPLAPLCPPRMPPQAQQPAADASAAHRRRHQPVSLRDPHRQPRRHPRHRDAACGGGGRRRPRPRLPGGRIAHGRITQAGLCSMEPGGGVAAAVSNSSSRGAGRQPADALACSSVARRAVTSVRQQRCREPDSKLGCPDTSLWRPSPVYDDSTIRPPALPGSRPLLCRQPQ